ncbi:transposase [Nocardia gipuzkoensis]
MLIAYDTGFLKRGCARRGTAPALRLGRSHGEQPDRSVPRLPSRHGHALVDRELYLPESWTTDRDRCRDAGIPEEVEFATEPRLCGYGSNSRTWPTCWPPAATTP